MDSTNNHYWKTVALIEDLHWCLRCGSLMRKDWVSPRPGLPAKRVTSFWAAGSLEKVAVQPPCVEKISDAEFIQYECLCREAGLKYHRRYCVESLHIWPLQQEVVVYRDREQADSDRDDDDEA